MNTYRAVTVMAIICLGVSVVAAGCGDDVTTSGTAGNGAAGGDGGSTTTTQPTVGGNGAQGGDGGIGGAGAQGGGGGMGGSGGPGEHPANVCPGDEYNIVEGMPLVINDSTDAPGTSDDYDPPQNTVGCGDTDSGPDHVYKINTTETGTLRFELTASGGLSSTFYVASSVNDGPGTCADYDGMAYFACSPPTLADEIQFENVTPRTFYIFVDGENGTSGDYELTVTLNPATCGDFTVNTLTNEECDDGNTNDNDGCDSTCQLEPPPVNTDLCLGETINVLSNSTTSISATTLGFNDDYVYMAGPMCTAPLDVPPNAGPEAVYNFLAPANGTVTASVGFDQSGTVNWCDIFTPGVDPECWDRVLWVSGPGVCGDPMAQLACSDLGFFEVETVTFPVTAGQAYYIMVDGFNNTQFSRGPFNLFVSHSTM